MNINYKQPQFELFPGNSSTLEDLNRPKFFLANLTLSMESLVILTILGIMMALFSFSLGVERGKQLAAQALDERVSAAWSLAPRKPALAVAAQQPPKGVAARATAPVPTGKPLAKAAALGNAGFVIRKTVADASRFTIQIASYKNEGLAKQLALGLKAKGGQSFLIKKGDFWLVCLGQFSSTESAESARQKVQSKFRDSSVRRF